MPRNTTNKGSRKELKTQRALEADDYTVASRRHVGGPADLLAVRQDGFGWDVILVEVKASPLRYMNFRPDDRQALSDYADAHGMRAYLAWWGPGAKEPELIPESDWPTP